MSSLVEQATINFYTWESRGRGYYLYDYPIELEPPYVPFEHISSVSTEYFDDGKVTLLGRLKSLVGSTNEAHEKQHVTNEVLPYAVNTEPKLECIAIRFPHGFEFSQHFMHEFLKVLSFSEDSFSFEILAQYGSIEVLFIAQKFDMKRLRSHLRAYFPQVIIQSKNALDIDFDFDKQVAITDFGLEHEFMLPIAQKEKLNIDPLTSVIATLETLQKQDIAIFQVLFKGVSASWSQDMIRAVSDGVGGDFFNGYPEMKTETKNKVSEPLFSVVLRIAVQCQSDNESRYIAQELARSFTTVSSSEHNRLIPLSNEGYKYDNHLRNVFYRTSNRLGCILNTKELATFVHYPNKTVISEKLRGEDSRTKKYINESKDGIIIGENTHQSTTQKVYLDNETRLSHTHIIGVTGVGKSTLIASMVLQDIKRGVGVALFDPHGDNCDNILKRIPRDRIKDVVLIDPSDTEFPIGFNLLQANSEIEKIVLSSDLVYAFKNHATAWGDNMTAVLQNVVSTMLESSRGGTLIELKRFLVEKKFRNEYLKTVNDPSLVYYWHNEYPMVRKGIAPLLTRIDTFLRPKIIRYMLAQKTGVDIKKCVQENKIVLIKLSQGLIGESNSCLLGSLFLAKFNQSVLARQNLDSSKRTPFMLYLDEFQNFITPSIERMLSGARKYSLGLTLAHQELSQINDTRLLNSVISNPKTRICFRLGDVDAKKLESGFSYFEASDFMSLKRGQAIARIGSQRNDFNVHTYPINDVNEDNTSEIIQSTRQQYCKTRAEVEHIINSLLPINRETNSTTKSKSVGISHTHEFQEKLQTDIENTSELEPHIIEQPSTLGQQKELYLKEIEQEEQEQLHRNLQLHVLKLGQQRGFLSEIETKTKSGGRIDVTLVKKNIKIAVEISVTNTSQYEVENIKKCIDEGYSIVYVICESKVHLSNINKTAKEKLESIELKKVQYGSPSDFLSFINKFSDTPKKNVKQVKGYRVKTNHIDINSVDASKRNHKIQEIILRSKKKK